MFTCTVGANPCLCDGDCTADFCGDRQCVVGGNECVNDFDCTADFCDMMCTQSGFPCHGSFDCPIPGEECVGNCSVGGRPCSSNGECDADFCQGACAVGGAVCSNDDQCMADTCVGACSVGGNACMTDDACTLDVCQGECLIGANPCEGDEDCTAPQTDLCSSSCTVGANACSSDADCTAIALDTLFWNAPAELGGTSVRYDTLRSPVPDDFTTPATCVETDALDRVTPDGTVPVSGAVLYYLIRVENACAVGNMGSATSGPRTGVVCE